MQGAADSNPGAGPTVTQQVPRSLEYSDFENLLPRGQPYSSNGTSASGLGGALGQHTSAAAASADAWRRRLLGGRVGSLLDKLAPRSRGFQPLKGTPADGGARGYGSSGGGTGVSATASAAAAEGAASRARTGRWCPEEDASWASRLFFAFVSSLMKMGAGSEMQQEDLWDVARRDEAAVVWARFERALGAVNNSVWRAMVRAHVRTFWWTGALKVFHDVVMFAQPAILRQLLQHLAGPGERWTAMAWAAAMLGAAILEALSINMYFHR